MKKDTPELRLLKNDKAHAYRHKDKSEPDETFMEESFLPPDNMSERAKEIFTETCNLLQAEYKLAKTDVGVLVVYSNNQEQLEAMELFLREKGVTYKEETMYGEKIRIRPESMVHDKCKAIAIKLLDGFKKLPKKPKTVGKANPFAGFAKVG